MNEYLVALVGLLALLATGYVVYGVVFKDAVKGNDATRSSSRMITAGIGMYLASCAFVTLYNSVDFASGVTGPMKGLYLGLLVGIPFFAIPFYIDTPYLKPNSSEMRAILINWVASFVVLGLVVGWLLK